MKSEKGAKFSIKIDEKLKPFDLNQFETEVEKKEKEAAAAEVREIELNKQMKIIKDSQP
jgi:hypothetical protein